jgi:hypothetical protein
MVFLLRMDSKDAVPKPPRMDSRRRNKKTIAMKTP